MDEKRLQILVSAVNKDIRKLPEVMNIESDAIFVNQIFGDKADKTYESEAVRGECHSSSRGYDEEIHYGDHKIRILNRYEKGVGLSRNTALSNSDHEIIQFGDDDIVYDKGYSRKILDEFDEHPEADILLFNVKAQAGRETYWNEDYAKVSWKNYGRYPCYAICARREKLIKSGVRYSLLFGGGAPYMAGEDSLFLHDCLKAGLKIYRTTVVLGRETPGESTWFKGYNKKFFYDRGVLYHFLYGGLAKIFGFRYLVKNRKEMCSELGFLRCYGQLWRGVNRGKAVR